MDRDVFAGRPTQILEEDSSPFAEVSVFALIEAVERVMRRTPEKLSHQVLVERISVAERVQELAEMLVQRKELTFDEFFPATADSALLVVTFIALLEMARLKMVRLHQTDHAGVIYIRGLLEEVNVAQALASFGIGE